MEQQHGFGSNKSSNLLLQYDKRRYDGGTERELIQAIEMGQQMFYSSVGSEGVAQAGGPALDPTMAAWAGMSAAKTKQEVKQPEEVLQPKLVETPKTKPAQKPSKVKKLFHNLILGPTEICVGLVGLPTCLLAFATFRYFNNQPMVEQSRVIFKDCLKTLGNGFVNTLTGPFKVARQVMSF